MSRLSPDLPQPPPSDLSLPRKAAAPILPALDNVIPPLKSKPIIPPPAASKPPVVEVSSKSFEELIDSSVIQLYCGFFNQTETTFSDISRGTGIIINEKGEIITNRHIIYNENSKKTRSDCFVLKSPFPNSKSQNPKIYYAAEIISYPAISKFSDSFSKDNYYNDFAVFKIASKPNSANKINLFLGFDYASPEDYSILENTAGVFNFSPIDWNYQPKDGDALITLGYGADAGHVANKITSTIGKLYGNISADGSLKPQILLIESNSTAGFSGGALINPQSKGLVGLISWVASGDEVGKYAAAIFRDFLKTQMLQDLNFELK
ncbi:serine protease [Candidatus Wolfebacteria bacterium]|nr:serine protease [Candidatus Wolfebacteria bacterium]